MTEEEHLHPQVHTRVCTLKHIHAHTYTTFKHTEFIGQDPGNFRCKSR